MSWSRRWFFPDAGVLVDLDLCLLEIMLGVAIGTNDFVLRVPFVCISIEWGHA